MKWKSIVPVGSWCSSSSNSQLVVYGRIKIRIFCGNSGKTEITWWAFPVFTQEKAEDGVGTYENQLLQLFEKQPDIHVNSGNDWLQVRSWKDHNGYWSRNCSRCAFDAPWTDHSVCKNGNWLIWNDFFTEDFGRMSIMKNITQASKAGDTATCGPISSAPFYMAMNKKMLKDAGVLILSKKAGQQTTWKVLKAWKTKVIHHVSLFSKWSRWRPRNSCLHCQPLWWFCYWWKK